MSDWKVINDAKIESERQNALETPFKLTRDEKLEWWFVFKSGLVCEECGHDHYAAVELYNTKTLKKVTPISIVTPTSKTKILDLVKGYKVWCANCYSLELYQQKQQPVAALEVRTVPVTIKADSVMSDEPLKKICIRKKEINI